MLNELKLVGNSEKVEHLESLVSIPSINPKMYDINDEYFRLDFISHDDYGVGFVEEVMNKFQVRIFFPEGERILSQCSYLQKNAC